MNEQYALKAFNQNLQFHFDDGEWLYPAKSAVARFRAVAASITAVKLVWYDEADRFFRVCVWVVFSWVLLLKWNNVTKCALLQHICHIANPLFADSMRKHFAKSYVTNFHIHGVKMCVCTSTCMYECHGSC